MKYYLGFLLLLINFPVFGQSIDQCGLDNDPFLSLAESTFLNEYFKSRNEGFDFNGKRIIFVTGNSGHQIGTKKEYFQSINSRLINNETIATTIVEFNSKEKKRSGGYDAILTYWVKVLTKKRKNKIIKKVN